MSSQQAWQHCEVVTHCGFAHPWALALVSVTSRSTETFGARLEPSGLMPRTATPASPPSQGCLPPQPWALAPCRSVVQAWLRPIGGEAIPSRPLNFPLSPKLSFWVWLWTNMLDLVSLIVVVRTGARLQAVALCLIRQVVTRGLQLDGLWRETCGDCYIGASGDWRNAVMNICLSVRPSGCPGLICFLDNLGFLNSVVCNMLFLPEGW